MTRLSRNRHNLLIKVLEAGPSGLDTTDEALKLSPSDKAQLNRMWMDHGWLKPERKTNDRWNFWRVTWQGERAMKMARFPELSKAQKRVLEQLCTNIREGVNKIDHVPSATGVSLGYRRVLGKSVAYEKRRFKTVEITTYHLTDFGAETCVAYGLLTKEEWGALEATR